jgi:hypothetical protein
MKKFFFYIFFSVKFTEPLDPSINKELKPSTIIPLEKNKKNTSFLYNNRSIKNNDFFYYLYFKYFFSVIDFSLKIIYTLALLSKSLNQNEQKNLKDPPQVTEQNLLDNTKENQEKFLQKQFEENFLDLYITATILTCIFKLIFFLYHQLQIQKNKDNYLYIINRSLYWKNNTIKKEYKDSQKWFYKNGDWSLNLMFFLINGIFGIGKFTWWVTVLNGLYYGVDILLSRLFFFLLDLGVIFFNNQMIEGLYIKPDDKTLLIRYYKPLNKEDHDQWLANTTALLEELSASHLEEEKFDIINNYFDDHCNNNNHEWLLIWNKKTEESR